MPTEIVTDNSLKIVVDLGGGLRPKQEANYSIDIHRDGTQDGVTFIKHDLNKTPLPFENCSVDRFINVHVLEHLDIAPEALISELSRCLKTYGTFLVVVPNAIFLTYRLEYLLGIIPQDFILAHKKHFTHRMIEYSLKNSGFKVNTRMNWKSFIPFRGLVQPTIKFEAYECPG